MFTIGTPIRLYGGLMFGMINAESVRTETSKGGYEDGSGRAPSVGAYMTVISDEDWFVDLTLRNVWSEMDMSNHSSNYGVISYNPSRQVMAASVEAGMDYTHYTSGSEYLKFSPKGEISFMRAGSDDTSVSNTNYKLHYDAANYVNVKGSVLFAYNLMNHSKGPLFGPFVEAGYRYEFEGEDTISYGNVTTTSVLRGGTAEFSAGVNAQVSDEVYLYAEGSYEKGSKISGWGAQFGLRYKFKPPLKLKGK